MSISLFYYVIWAIQLRGEDETPTFLTHQIYMNFNLHTEIISSLSLIYWHVPKCEVSRRNTFSFFSLLSNLSVSVSVHRHPLALRYLLCLQTLSCAPHRNICKCLYQLRWYFVWHIPCTHSVFPPQLWKQSCKLSFHHSQHHSLHIPSLVILKPYLPCWIFHHTLHGVGKNQELIC